jgi:hypothetical protein
MPLNLRKLTKTALSYIFRTYQLVVVVGGGGGGGGGQKKKPRAGGTNFKLVRLS